MRPQDAARSFLEVIVRTTFGSALDLADPTWFRDDLAAKTHRAAYQRVESVVRHRSRLTYDLDALEHAVRAAVPEEHRAAVAVALTRFTDAVNDEFTVKQEAAYLVGIGIGAALDPSLTRLLGEGWTLPDPPPTEARRRKAGLAVEATIVKESDHEYQVWLGLPDDPGGWQTNAFIAGIFPTFDAATASLLAVKGVRLAQIRSEGITSDDGGGR